MERIYLSETEKIILKGLSIAQYEPGMFNDLSREELYVSSKRLKDFGLVYSHYADGNILVAARISDEGIVYLKENKTLENPVDENELKRLQKESLEYQLTIREQQDRIRNLEEKTKFIELLKGYWWVIGISIGIGIGLKELLDIITQ